MKNEAAWIKIKTGYPLEVGPGPEPNPGANEVVIKIAYAAVNPADWKIQGSDFLNFPYPFILGADVSGRVHQVGSAVTRFKSGQRVIGQCASFYTLKPTDSAFQTYTTCLETLVAAIPDSLPFANAAVLPLGTGTAAAALYTKEFLNLALPSTDPTPTGKAVFVWGGSSSVGSCAIQLAVASGYTVFTTASAHNHDYVKSLGAARAFDHHSPDVVLDIVSALKETDFAGAFDAIATDETVKATAEIVSRLGGGVLPLSLPPPAELPENVEGVWVSGLASAFEAPYLAEPIWGTFVPETLAKGVYQAKPDPLIVHGGLEKVQEGLEISKKGVSARKVVIEIDPML